MSKKYSKEELFKMDAVEVYKMVLKKDIIKKFPDGFWQQPEAKQNAIKCMKYLIEDILKYDKEELKKNLSMRMFRENALAGMLITCFDNSPYKAINSLYVDEFKQWEFKMVSNGFWKNKQNGIEATKWLIETKLGLSDEQIRNELCVELFEKNGLGGMLQYCFNSSPYEAISCSFPGKFQQWEFRNTPNEFWKDRQNGIKATKWLIETKLGLSKSELKEQLSFDLFSDNGLSGMLVICFEGSPYKAINATYPNEFTKEDFVGYKNHNKMV